MEKLDNRVMTDKESKEEEFLTALLLANRLVSSVEEKGYRKVIVFKSTGRGWSWDYCNITNPRDVIEALAPMWASARTAVQSE